uniref:Uncharacterized protein n=1 Tax=Oryza rufipogon TaxID=4529 RepID=A0A0E0MZF6_ORYRU
MFSSSRSRTPPCRSIPSPAFVNFSSSWRRMIWWQLHFSRSLAVDSRHRSPKHHCRFDSRRRCESAWCPTA